jgi:hypothetical protein
VIKNRALNQQRIIYTYIIPRLNTRVMATLVTLSICRAQRTGSGSVSRISRISRSTIMSKMAKLIYAGFRFSQCPSVTKRDQLILAGRQMTNDIVIVAIAHKVKTTISVRAHTISIGVENMQARDQQMLIFTNPNGAA